MDLVRAFFLVVRCKSEGSEADERNWHPTRRSAAEHGSMAYRDLELENSKAKILLP